MPDANLLLLTNLIATWFMVGLIWFVQLVHYPQFAGIGVESFCDLHARHTRFTTFVVGPPMLVEALSAIGLLVARPQIVPVWIVWTGATLIGVIWLSTAFLQVPTHNRLAAALDARECARLVRGNWVRTIAWTARGALMAYAAALLLNF